MKKLLFILMVGSLFADTIKYTYKGELKVKKDVTFKRADDKYIHYITSSKSFSKIECDKVVEITSTKGENIEFSCLKVSTVIQKEPDKKVSETNLNKRPIPTSNFSARQVGGGFISMGAFVLYNNLGKECEDRYGGECNKSSEITDFLNSVEESQKTGYILIFLGGLLILFDSDDIGTSESVKPSTQNQSD